MIIKRTYSFEVADKDVEGSHTWGAAQMRGARGWRLPTIDELHMIYESRGLDEGLGKGWYWSSTMGTLLDAMAIDFSDGSLVCYYKENKKSVRLVRDIEE